MYSYPQHLINEQLLIHHFYERMLHMDKNILDASSGGKLFYNTLEATIDLIENMSLNF